MTEKLKSCPFCGGEAQIREYNEYNPNGADNIYFIAECNKCGVEYNFFRTEEESIAAWNTRAEDENPSLTLYEIRK